MPAVSRQGDALSTGHICAAATTLTSPGQSSVLAEGKAVARQGDSTVAHAFPPSPACNPHVATIGGGLSSVLVEGSPIARVGDAADAGALTSGASTVFAG